MKVLVDLLEATMFPRVKKKKKHGPCTNAHHSGVLGTVPRVGVYLWLRAAAG